MEHPRTVALFDFDGTITHRDTLLEFTRFAVGEARYISSMFYLALPLALQKMSILSSQPTKQIFLTHFFKNWKLPDFEQCCQRFDSEVLPGLIRAPALEAIQSYVQRGDRTIIVSASPQNWILPWARKQGVEVIATKLEVNGDCLTGRIDGKNCNGNEKVNRIRQYLDLNDYKEIIAYGDSGGDRAMFGLATRAYFKPFRSVEVAVPRW